MNGVSYIAVITGLLLMQLPRRMQAEHPAKALTGFTQGFRYVRHTTPVRDLMLMVALISFAGQPFATLMPIFAEDVLHGGARGLGLLSPRPGSDHLREPCCSPPARRSGALAALSAYRRWCSGSR